MRDTNALVSAAFVLVAAFAAPPAGAQPPGSPSGMAKAHKAEAGEPRPSKAEDRAAAKAGRADEKRDKLDEKKADGGPAAAGSVPMHDVGKGRFHRRGFRRLAGDFQHGSVSKEQLKDRIKEMHASRMERQKEHRAELKARWGSALLHPSVRQELRHHARREAFLTRMLFVAQTEVTGKKRHALIERIEKLIDKEEQRHTRAMERLKSMPMPPASASAMGSASAAPAASTPAPAASAAASAPLPQPAHSAKAGAQ